MTSRCWVISGQGGGMEEREQRVQCLVLQVLPLCPLLRRSVLWGRVSRVGFCGGDELSSGPAVPSLVL